MDQISVSLPDRKPLIVKNTSFLSADDHNLSGKDQEKARSELNETDEIRNSSIQQLKEKLSGDPKVNYRTDDAYLLRFLRVRKFDIEKACKTIQDFYSVRKKHPEVFSLPSNLEYLLRLDFYTRLPFMDEEGRVIFKVDYAKWNTAEVSFFEILALMIVVTDIVTMNPKSQINGIIGIWDMKGMTASHFAQFMYPRRIMLFFNILQGCYPWRMKAIIGVNCGRFSQLFYKAVQPFVKTKIIERVLLLGSDMTELHQYVNPAILPKQFGGQLEDNECSVTEHVLNNLPYLKYERSFGHKNTD